MYIAPFSTGKHKKKLKKKYSNWWIAKITKSVQKF